MAWSGSSQRLNWGSGQRSGGNVPTRAASNVGYSGESRGRGQSKGDGYEHGNKNWREVIRDDRSVSERPKWQLTSYGHTREGPNDISGDISPEEVRWANMSMAAQQKATLGQLSSQFKSAEYAMKEQFQALMKSSKPPSLGGRQIPPPKATIDGLYWLSGGNAALGNSSSSPGGFEGSSLGIQSSMQTNFTSSQKIAFGNQKADSSGSISGFDHGFQNAAPMAGAFNVGQGVASTGGSSQQKMGGPFGGFGSAIATNQPQLGANIGAQPAGFGSTFGGGSFSGAFGTQPKPSSFGQNSFLQQKQDEFADNKQGFLSQSVTSNQQPYGFSSSFGQGPTNPFQTSFGSQHQPVQFGSLGTFEASKAAEENFSMNMSSTTPGTFGTQLNEPEPCSEEEAEVWRAMKFQRGKIPEKAPPIQFCR